MPHAALALDTAPSAPHAASEPAARLSPLDAVIETVAARREEFERLSHVPRDVIALFKQAGIYRAGTPRRFGGDALAPTAFLDMIERIATADGSAAWVASFGSANVYLAALPLDTQAELYASGPDQVFAGGLFPVQPAQPAPGGWRVNGTWKFASGCKGPTGSASASPCRVRRTPRRTSRARPCSARPTSRSSRTGAWSACRAPAATTCAWTTASCPKRGPLCAAASRPSTSRCTAIRPSRTRRRCWPS